MAVTKQQVRVYMSTRETGHTQVTAAAKAGFSERTARRLEQCELLPGQVKLRHWRTRPDPFAGVWALELVPLLEAHPHLEAITLLEALQERYPGNYPDKLLRTLQRCVKHWRALYGGDKEVMFRQLTYLVSWGCRILRSSRAWRSRSEAKCCPIGYTTFV
jgi:hypothetical protein